MQKIVVKGYYGFGNFGDDLLMVTCCHWLKETFPKSIILICTAANDGGYIKRLTNGVVDSILPLAPEPEADLVVHGGGGTYFDYKHGGIFYWWLNRTIRLIGIHHFTNWFKRYRNLRGWPANKNTLRIALGIGVGGFTSDSKKFYHKIYELNGFHLLVVRDRFSEQWALKNNIRSELKQGVDLAFLKDYWLPEKLRTHKTKGKSIGLVIRSWLNHQRYLTSLHQCISRLMDQGYSISVFLFQQESDGQFTEQFSGIERYTWDPGTMHFKDYLELLAGQDLIVTSRAHGVLIAAAMGIPAVTLGIDSKLKSFHDMLPNSGVYIELPVETSSLMKEIMACLSIPKRQITEDFESKFGEAKECMHWVRKWLLGKLNTNNI